MPSLRGRYFIDCLKRWTLAQLNLSLPVPPYGTSQYWDHAYRSMLQQPDQVEPQEWGDASYETLKEYHYKMLSVPTSLLLSSSPQQPLSSKVSYYNPHQMNHIQPIPTTLDSSHATRPVHSTTLAETIGLTENDNDDDNDEDNEEEDNDIDGFTKSKKAPIVILGCGISRLGTDLAAHEPSLGRRTVIQVDWSPHIVQLQTLFCHDQVQSGALHIYEDSAAQLSSISQDNSIQAVLDKGLMDPLSCTYAHHDGRSKHVQDIFRAVHRVLKPNGYYCIWSLSQPEFLLPVLEQENLIQPTSDYEDDTDNNKDRNATGDLSQEEDRSVFSPQHLDRPSMPSSPLLSIQQQQQKRLQNTYRNYQPLASLSSSSSSTSTTTIPTRTPRNPMTGKPYLWQRLDIRHDVTNQFLLYRFQKAAASDPFSTTTRRRGGGGAQPPSSRLPRHSANNKNNKNNHRQRRA